MKCLSYDGTGDPKEFIKKFQLQAAMFGWNQDKQVAILPNIFSAKAERIYESLSTDEKKEPDVILKAISGGCMLTKEVLLQQFYNSKPVSGELLSTFALKLQEALNKALPGLGLVEKNAILRSQLIAYLPDYMKALIQYNQSQTWDDLLVALDSSHPYISSTESAGCVSFKNEALEANTINASASNTFNGVCHGCKKVGHKRYECPERRSFNSNESNSYNNRSNNYRSNNYSNSSRDTRQSSYNNGNRDNRSSKYEPNNYRDYRDNDKHKDRSRYNNKDDRSQKNQKSANTMQLKENCSSEDDNNDSNTELNLIEAIATKLISRNMRVEFNTLVAKVPLLKRPVRFTIGLDKQICKVRGLFDGGASNSFIRLASLPAQIQHAIRNFKNGINTSSQFKLEKENLIILSATGEVSECCTVAKVHLEIGEWRGIHSFVITESLVEKDMILGRDFLKTYEVVIDHGTDEIIIKKSLNLQKFTDPVCYSVETKVLEPNTENFVTCHSNVISGGRNVLFTPDINTDGVYWANCLSTVDHAGDFIVKVLNLNDSKVELTNGMPVGAITESYTILEDSHTIELKTITVDKSKGININEKPNRDRISKLKFGNKLTAEQRNRLVVVIKSKMDAFQWEETDIGLTDLVEHEIITGSNKPIKLKQYKIPQAVQGVLDEQIEE